MPSSQLVNTLKTANGQCIPLINVMMNSKKASKEVAKSFIDLENMADGWKPATICSTRFWKTVPLYRGGGRGDESRDLHRLVQVNHLFLQQLNASFATLSTTKQTAAEIWHTIKPETPEHGTPVERRNNAGTTEQQNMENQQNSPGIPEYQNNKTMVE